MVTIFAATPDMLKLRLKPNSRVSAQNMPKIAVYHGMRLAVTPPRANINSTNSMGKLPNSAVSTPLRMNSLNSLP